MNDERLAVIRRAEAYSHTEAYTNLTLFESGSWLSKPVKSIMEIVPYFQEYERFQGLDLGCGIGRNCIPVLQTLRRIPSAMDCVDILELAIEKLKENAEKYGVDDRINPIVSSVDDYQIEQNRYDLIIASAVLEHLDSFETLSKKLHQIKNGLKYGGIACFVVNTSIAEHDKRTQEKQSVQFEINMQTPALEDILHAVFAGFELLKHSVIHYKYDTFRESGITELDTDVLTYVVRKRS